MFAASMGTTPVLFATLGPVAMFAYRTATTATLESRSGEKPEAAGDWQMVCQGYVTDVGKGRRRGLGHAAEEHLGEAACRSACDRQGECNFVTYDTQSGKCWMEKMLDMPTQTQCDDNISGFSHYRGRLTSNLVPHTVVLADHAPLAVPMGWHFFCNGYLQDKGGRTGFGASTGKEQGLEACLQNCHRRTGCNFITYDNLQGVCWLEHIVGEPHHCDDNHAGVTYWYHNDDENWSLEGFHFLDEPNGWHFVCTGYVTGRYGPGRKGLGGAQQKHLGQQGCKDACDSHEECNFVTYDSWKGICWLEYHKDMPDVCDRNVAGWSYWRGHLDISLTEENWLKGMDWADDLGSELDSNDLEHDINLAEWA